MAEAIRNVISMGATPYAVVDCLNFGNPETPEILWQFKRTIEGMSLVAENFNAPVISGNEVSIMKPKVLKSILLLLLVL